MWQPTWPTRAGYLGSAKPILSRCQTNRRTLFRRSAERTWRRAASRISPESPRPVTTTLRPANAPGPSASSPASANLAIVKPLAWPIAR